MRITMTSVISEPSGVSAIALNTCASGVPIWLYCKPSLVNFSSEWYHANQYESMIWQWWYVIVLLSCGWGVSLTYSPASKLFNTLTNNYNINSIINERPLVTTAISERNVITSSCSAGDPPCVCNHSPESPISYHIIPTSIQSYVIVSWGRWHIQCRCWDMWGWQYPAHIDAVRPLLRVDLSFRHLPPNQSIKWISYICAIVKICSFVRKTSEMNRQTSEHLWLIIIVPARAYSCSLSLLV